MSFENTIDLRIFIAILRRRLLLIAICFLVLMGGAITIISFIKEEFTAEATVLLDKKISGAVLELSQVPQLGLDKAAIESEIEIIHSQTVMDIVIELLNATPLSENSEIPSRPSSGVDDFMQKYRQGLQNITHKESKALFFKEQASESETGFQQYQDLLKGLAVTRVGDSYVLRISYTATTPDVAAQMANAFANAYIKEQRRVLAIKSDQTLTWFQAKLDDLKRMAQKADKSVADFRLRYNTQGSSGTTLNQLNVLVKESETYHQILNDYLDRYQTMNQESSFPVSESRVITQALPPPNRSHPKTPLLLGVASIIALGLGVIIALFIDLSEKSIRRAGQLSTELTIPFIGFVPALRFWQKIKAQPIKIIDGKPVAKEQQIYALQNPQNDYAIAVRSMAAHLSQFSVNSGVRVGMTHMDSSSTNSQLMYNLSEYLAIGEAKCLYIDTAFVYSNDNNKNKGWVNLMAGEVNLEDVLLKSSHSNLHILPAGYARNIKAVSSVSSDAIKKIFESLSSHYDFILVNLPDLKKSADLQIIASHLDGCFINLKWGKSTVQSTKFYLHKSGIAANKILGALLSDTHLGKLKRHYGYDA
jgi:uncharacterized protein involved in exopolysaccharide biosynthesis